MSEDGLGTGINDQSSLSQRVDELGHVAAHVGSAVALRQGGDDLLKRALAVAQLQHGTKDAFAKSGAIWTMNADGTSATSVYSTTTASEPTWSADGTELAFVSSGGVIETMNADGSSVTSLSTSGATDPQWSPGGTKIAYLVGGAAVIETVFSIPGEGQLIIKAIFDRDYPIIQGATLMFGLLVLFINLVTDLIYGLLDPRVTYA